MLVDNSIAMMKYNVDQYSAFSKMVTK